MKAIDFACQLLRQLAEDELSFSSQQVLLAVAAGQYSAKEVARFLNLPAAGASGILRALANKNLLERVGCPHVTYRLSPWGRERVRKYLTFRPEA